MWFVRNWAAGAVGMIGCFCGIATVPAEDTGAAALAVQAQVEGISEYHLDNGPAGIAVS